MQEYEEGDKDKKMGFQLYIITNDHDKMLVREDNSRQNRLEDFKEGFGMRKFGLWKDIDKYINKNTDSVEFGVTIYLGPCVEREKRRTEVRI